VRLFVGGPFRFRMYPRGCRSLAEGWTKNLASGAATVPAWRSALVGLWITSLAVVAERLIGALGSGGGRLLVALLAYAATATAVAAMLRRVGSFRVATAVLFPIPLAVFCGLFVRSLLHTFVLGRVSWKGREIAVGRRARLGALRESEA
jgi:4,4'-diaponeurosporenoate glycosyltransferase